MYNFKPLERDSFNQGEKRFQNLNHKIKPKQTKPVLSEPDVKKHLEKLHRKFVIAAIHNTSNNYAFYVQNSTLPNY